MWKQTITHIQLLCGLHHIIMQTGDKLKKQSKQTSVETYECRCVEQLLCWGRTFLVFFQYVNIWISILKLTITSFDQWSQRPVEFKRFLWQRAVKLFWRLAVKQQLYVGFSFDGPPVCTTNMNSTFKKGTSSNEPTSPAVYQQKQLMHWDLSSQSTAGG